MDEILFISDLHLSAQEPATVERFLAFCATRAAGAAGLYILGDLFDTWIGDDDDSAPYPDIREALKTLVEGGTPVYLQHGNRDFLLGEHFCAQTGASLLGEEAVVDLYGTPTLLMHGDTLCTDDIAYQEARKLLRSPDFVAEFLGRSLAERAAIAAEYRRQSGEATSLLAADIMDVNSDAVRQSMERHGVRRLIHGHTHRQAIHELEVAGQRAQRIVLGEWHPDHGSCLAVTAEGLREEEV